MRSLAWAFLVFASLAATSGHTSKHVIEVSTADELMAALHGPLEDTTVRLAPGTYHLDSSRGAGADMGCGDLQTTGFVGIGMRISGRNVRILGSTEGDVIIETRASYGIYLDGCVDCDVQHIMVASNVDSLGPGGGIVARSGRVRIVNCVLRDTAEKHVVGIAGILGCEDTDLILDHNEIINNSYGIILLGDARAVITNNLLTGRGRFPYSDGEGVLVLCRATTTVAGNLLRGFSTGIKVSEDASLTCTGNIIEQIRAVGVDLVAARGNRTKVEENVFFQCGGGAIDGVTHQAVWRNLIVETGYLDAPAHTIQIADGGGGDGVRKNTFYDNHATSDSTGRGSREIFWRARRPWTRTYRNTPVGVDGRHKFYESAFLTRYGRWAD